MILFHYQIVVCIITLALEKKVSFQDFTKSSNFLSRSVTSLSCFFLSISGNPKRNGIHSHIGPLWKICYTKRDCRRLVVNVRVINYLITPCDLMIATSAIRSYTHGAAPPCLTEGTVFCFCVYVSVRRFLHKL